MEIDAFDLWLLLLYSKIYFLHAILFTFLTCYNHDTLRNHITITCLSIYKQFQEKHGYYVIYVIDCHMIANKTAKIMSR